MSSDIKPKDSVKKKKRSPERDKAREKVKNKGVLKFRKQIQEAIKFYK